jgi:DNA polymerase-3 subunit gamma/tau
MASNCVLESITDGRFELSLDPAHSSLFNTIQSERLADAISEQLGQAAQVHIQVAAAAGQTPAKLLEDQRHRALKQAEQTLVSDPGVQQLMSGFGATIVKGSVTPMSGRGES